MNHRRKVTADKPQRSTGLWEPLPTVSPSLRDPSTTTFHIGVPKPGGYFASSSTRPDKISEVARVVLGGPFSGSFDSRKKPSALFTLTR